MPTKKKTASEQARADSKLKETYEAALKEYAAAIELMHKSEYEKARGLFEKLETDYGHEAELVERARTYARICQQRSAGTQAGPESVPEMYRSAVFLSNDGQWDEAIRLLDRAVRMDPTSVDCLYARASAWALKGDAERAVTDLRQAITGDPTVRFQAVNDPDFERIREEPAFIDIIEPTPTGAR